MYSSRQGYAVIEPFDPTTAFILSVVEGLRAPLRSGNYEINALTTLAVAITRWMGLPDAESRFKRRGKKYCSRWYNL